MPFLQYVYVFLWAALGVLCVFIGKKYGITAAIIAVWYVQRKRRLSELSEVIPHAEDCHCEHCEEEHEEEHTEK